MYDPETAALIRATPPLEGLEREELPDLLTEAFAEIVAARIRLREGYEEEPEELASLLENIRRLAYTNEALVSVAPTREDRRSAAFVAATAHQLCANADRLFGETGSPTYLEPHDISSDIAATLLFLVAEAMADAREVANAMSMESGAPLENAVISAIRDLARGELVGLSERQPPTPEEFASEDPPTVAVRALYREVLKGIRLLANEILQGIPDDQGRPIPTFRRVRDLCIGPEHGIDELGNGGPVSTFSGPHHLASLLIALSGDLSEGAVTRVPCPSGVDPDKWTEHTRQIATTRPFVWRNHRDAIGKGYLELGTSAAIGFPTGAGKSTLAELKISAALLADRNVIFLAPTHSLVDQTARSLSRAFPTASVQRERQDEFGFLSGLDEMPEVLVMTPESCLAQMSIDPAMLEDVGLCVFDECHLLHQGSHPDDRRAIDAMLCVLNLSKVAVSADFLFMSAMMRNTDDIAGWIHQLTERPCLSLNLPWKPTRQLRGSVVYHQETLDGLQKKLLTARRSSTTSHPPAALRRNLKALPFALFGMKQTWATRQRDDYALVGLLDDDILLAASNFWRLTPNAVAVSSAIASASSEAGLKTLVFFQTIKNAASAAQQITAILESAPIRLTDEESRWLEAATLELGGPSHLYLDIGDGQVVQAAAVHHGLLLPEERHLCESLYRRRDGIKVLTATSTLAQGMNLPSELVIIGEDSRFDSATDRREILQAQELLNAAGRAGRAGEHSCGVVLIVPGKVVGIDFDEATIGSHWTDLQAVFGQSDQCLDIDDPLTAVLDRVHEAVDSAREVERYAIARLASGPAGETDAGNLSRSIKSSLAAYFAKKKGDDEWVEERIKSSAAFLSSQSAETEEEMIQSQVAASLGLPKSLISRLAASLDSNGPGSDASVFTWRCWFFDWLAENADLLEQALRPQSLAELIGIKAYEEVKDDEGRAAIVLPVLREMATRWMDGEPMTRLQGVLEDDPRKLKKCEGARRFVLRVVPDLSYLLGLPGLLHERAQVGAEEPVLLPSAVTQLRNCVRLGFDTPEKAALNVVVRTARFSRRQLHQRFATIVRYLEPAPAGEFWAGTIARVQKAVDDELNSREDYEYE